MKKLIAGMLHGWGPGRFALQLEMTAELEAQWCRGAGGWSIEVSVAGEAFLAAHSQMNAGTASFQSARALFDQMKL